MPSKSHLEPRGAKSVTKTCFLKVPNSGRIPGLACLAGLGLLGLPRLGSASLALPAPRNNSPAAFGGRAARSAAAVVAGAGKASEADARRGEPSKARPGAYSPCVWRLAHLETFSEKCTLKNVTFVDVFFRGIRYRDLIRLVIWSQMH